MAPGARAADCLAAARAAAADSRTAGGGKEAARLEGSGFGCAAEANTGEAVLLRFLLQSGLAVFVCRNLSAASSGASACKAGLGRTGDSGIEAVACASVCSPEFSNLHAQAAAADDDAVPLSKDKLM